MYSRTPTLPGDDRRGHRLLSAGRCVLGPRRVRPAGDRGLPRRQLRRPAGCTREVIEICRKVWRRETRSSTREALHDPAAARSRAPGSARPLKIITTRFGSHPDLHRGDRPEERGADRRDRRRLAAVPLPPREGPDVLGDALAAGTRSAIPSSARWSRRRRASWSSDDDVEPLARRPQPGRALHRRHGRQGQELLQLPRAPTTATRRRPRDPGPLPRGKKDEAAAAVPDDLVDRRVPDRADGVPSRNGSRRCGRPG